MIQHLINIGNLSITTNTNITNGDWLNTVKDAECSRLALLVKLTR